MELGSILWYGGITAVIIILAVAFFIAFFKRATKEISIIRTGLGGEKIIMDNGGFVVPLLHDALVINLNLIKLEITREKHEAFITKNRLRVDITADFSIRVIPEPQAISLAGQTLGKKTQDTEALKEQLEASCVEALREAAAKMTLESLHDDNDQINDIVEKAIGVDLKRFGLQLESVAIAKLHQTDMEFFDRKNALDVEGITYIENRIAENEKEQARVKNEKEVEIKLSDVNAHKEKLKLEEDKVFAEQQQELAIAKAELDKDRQKEEAKMEEGIAVAAAHKATAEAWIQTYEVQATEIAKKEEITTAKETTMAQRNKEVEIISATREAERTEIFAAAQATADKLNASAAEIRYAVDAAGKHAINEAANILSDEQISMQVKEKIVAQLPNIIKESVKPIENIEGIKIMQVDGLSNFTGSSNGGSNSSSGGNNGNGGGSSLPDQLIDSALRYKTQAPMIDNLLKEVGLSGGGISDLTNSLQKDMGFNTETPEKPTEKEIEQKAQIDQMKKKLTDESDDSTVEKAS